MMKQTLFALCFLMSMATLTGQNEKLPYDQIPEAPESYTGPNVAARMIDGLGFRFYWATYGLTDKDLAYKPSESGRSTSETIDHIFGLCNFVNYSITQEKEEGAKPVGELNFQEKRAKTLLTLKQMSDLLRKAENLEDFNGSYPFWNNINGPIADAIWHTGQVVLLRRASGNPMPKGVSVFNGTKK